MSQRRFGFDQPMSAQDVLSVMPTTGEGLTRREIALALMRGKSPTLLARIAEAVGRGWLVYELIKLPNQVDMYVYKLTEAGYEAYYGVKYEHVG